MKTTPYKRENAPPKIPLQRVTISRRRELWYLVIKSYGKSPQRVIVSRWSELPQLVEGTLRPSHIQLFINTIQHPLEHKNKVRIQVSFDALEKINTSYTRAK